MIKKTGLTVKAAPALGACLSYYYYLPADIIVIITSFLHDLYMIALLRLMKLAACTLIPVSLPKRSLGAIAVGPAASVCLFVLKLKH